VRSCIQGLRFFHQVEHARQAPFAGELVYCGEEFLQAFESLLALDLEKSPDMSARLHAGLDVRIHPLLGLRAGFDAGRLTAGMGVAWRDFRMEYAYGSGDLSGIHRVGISRALGATVAQRREAAMKAREGALQQALDDAFQKRQTEQLTDLLAQARSAQAAGDHQRALEVLATIAILDPSQPEAKEMEIVSRRERTKQLQADSLRLKLAADSLALAQKTALTQKASGLTPKTSVIAAKPVPAPRPGFPVWRMKSPVSRRRTGESGSWLPRWIRRWRSSRRTPSGRWT